MTRKRWVVIASVLLSAAGVFYLSHPHGLEGDARAYLSAELNNDPDRVFEYASPEEIAAEGLTPGKFRLVWTNLIAPRIALYQVVGAVSSESLGLSDKSQPPTEATAEIPMQAITNGHAFTLPAEVFVGDPHPCEEGVLHAELVYAWRMEFFARNNVPTTLPNLISAEIIGLKHDGAFLRNPGIKGFYRRPDLPFYTFDEYQARDQQLYNGAISNATALLEPFKVAKGGPARKQ